MRNYYYYYYTLLQLDESRPISAKWNIKGEFARLCGATIDTTGKMLSPIFSLFFFVIKKKIKRFLAKFFFFFSTFLDDVADAALKRSVDMEMGVVLCASATVKLLPVVRGKPLYFSLLAYQKKKKRKKYSCKSANL